MKTTLTNEFGSPIIRIKNALLALKSGKGIILLDDENRENEGDFVFSSEAISIEKMALVIRYGSGIVCLCITEKKRQQLELPMMVQKNTSTYGTGFTVSIEAKLGITTGVSAQDRLTTIQAASAKNASPNDLNKPGHIFPLRGHCDGILARPGHTEASLELMTLAGLQPTSIICELTNKDGSMAKTPEVINF